MSRAGTALAREFPGLTLGAFYFLFFAKVGVFLPYWTLYLGALGLSAATIGSLMAVMMGTRIVAPFFWGWLADRRGRRMGVIRAGAWVAVLCFALVPGVRDPLTLAAIIVAYSVFWTAVLPQFEAVTLDHLGPARARYSRIRLWGSVGFVVASALIGTLLDRTDVLSVPWILLAMMAAVALLSQAVAEPSAPRASDVGASRHHARPVPWRAIGLFLLACALMQASHGPYYVFFSIYLEGLGYPRLEIGALWSLGVIAEVALFAIMPRVLAAARVGPLFTLCFALTVGRWLALALLPVSLPMLVLVQVLHAVSFGAYHALAIDLVHRLFSGGRLGRGQALYSALSFGAGGAAGSAAAGWLWSTAGAQPAWLAAAGTAALGGVVAWRLARSGASRDHGLR